MARIRTVVVLPAPFGPSRPYTVPEATARYPFVWHLPGVSPEQDASRHAPVLSRMLELIRCGQESGDLDATLPPGWLLTAILALGRAAEEEVKAGRMTIEGATHAVNQSFLRLLGVPDIPQR